MARLIPSIGLVGLALGLDAPAVGASNLTPLSQSRSVSAEAYKDYSSPGEIDSASAADFDRFDTVVTVNATLDGVVVSSAQASQDSGFGVGPSPGSEGIFASGDAGSDALGGTLGSSQARSDFSISFALAEPASYQLPWFLANRYGLESFGFASFTLRGGPNDEIVAHGQTFFETGSGGIGGYHSGALPAGDYLIEAHAEANSLFSPEEAFASFQVLLGLVPYAPGVIALVPALSLNAPGGDHTVTATVRDQFNAPVRTSR